MNVFSDEEKTAFGLSKNFWYPNELKIVESGREAEVLESRFAGNHYWNRVSLQGKSLVMYTEDQLQDVVKINF